MKKQLYGIDDRTAVHCSTEELANEVLRIAHEAGYEWLHGVSFVDDNCWRFDKENTCYNIHGGTYGLLEFYKEVAYKILPAEEFIKLNTISVNTIFTNIDRATNSTAECRPKDLFEGEMYHHFIPYQNEKAE